MKHFTSSIFFLMCFLIMGNNRLFSQVAINNNGSPPNPSAMLDIQSTNKGLLLPRIDFNNRPANPVAGLMIFVTANGPVGNNALYIYNGSGWSLVSFTTYSLFQHIGGGVIFYLDPSGQHGLISSTMDQSTYAAYGCDSMLIGPTAEHTGLGTGDTNTMTIVNSCSAPGIAAKICDTLTLNGLTDWYLPAIDELDSMAVHKDMIGGIDTTQWYRSSTEKDIYGAWIYIWTTFYTGPAWSDKYYGFSVRCIRKF